MALEQEDYGGAEESIRRVLQADGKNAEAHVDLGVAYKGMGHLDKAMAEYDTAEKLNPKLPAIYLNRGIILAQKGVPEKAIELFRQYVALSGNNETLAQDLIRESEAVLQKREEDKKAAEEAKKMEEEMKKQEDTAKAEEKKLAEEELKRQQAEAKGAGPKVSPAKGDSADEGKKKGSGAEKPKKGESKKAEPKKAEEPKAEPVKKPAGTEDEPEDF
jgi:Tfp pilus assembly protein PilF